MYIIHYRFSYRSNHLNLCPIRVIRKEIYTTFAIFRYTMLLKIYITSVTFSFHLCENRVVFIALLKYVRTVRI